MIYPFPIQQPAPSITQPLTTGMFKAVLHAIQAKLPEKRQPKQFARELIAIADRYEVPPEILCDWLGLKLPEHTCAAFQCFAEEYDAWASQVLSAVKQDA